MRPRLLAACTFSVLAMTCGAEERSAGGAGGTGAAGGTTASGGSGGTWPDGGGGSGAGEPVDPGPPTFPEVIERLTITVRTGTGTNDGSDDNSLEVCLADSACFPIEVAGADDFENGDFGVYHFESVGLPRSAVERIEIRSTNGPDAWRPSCMEIQFDGEPVYCEEDIDVWIGTDATDNESWIDPSGLHSACTTCYPSALSHGPMLGAASPDSARIWLRTDATRRVRLSLFDPAAAGGERVVGYAYPLPENDYTTVFDVGSLAAGQSQGYAIDVEGAERLTGNLRTAPLPGAAEVTRIAVASCAQQAPRPDKGLADGRPLFGEVLARDPDLFLWVGDNIYPDYIQSAPDLATLRYHYRRAISFPEQLAVAGTVPTIAIWDDHDYAGNNTDASAPNKQHGLRAFEEYWANPAYGTPEAAGVFHSLSWGRVEAFMLDVRYHRSPDPKGVFDETGTVLGTGQMTWLKQRLLASQATFKLLVSGTLFSYTGTSNQSESWAEYPTARDELFDFIRDQKIGGVVLVSGDIHRSVFRKLSRQAAGGYDLPELVSSPLHNTSGTCSDPFSDAEQIVCVDGVQLFMTLDVDTTAADPTLTATLIDGAGTEHATWTIARSELE